MYADGLIGNRGILEVLGTLTAGQFNKMLPKGKPAYKLQDIIPRAFEYLYPPLSEQDKKKQHAVIKYLEDMKDKMKNYQFFGLEII